MKFSLYSREIKMLLHLFSISIFSVPITTQVLTIALDKTFSIGGWTFEYWHSTALIILILLIISVNIISIMTDKAHKLTLLITGIFFFTVTLIQLAVLQAEIEMIILGYDWPESASRFEAWMTGIFCAILILYVGFFKGEQQITKKTSRIQTPNLLILLKNLINKFQNTIQQLDRRLAFLLGILFSLLLAIPICAVFYIVAGFLIGEPFLNPQKMKLLAWIGIVGMQGSVVSMFFGLRRFKEKHLEIDSLGLFLNALVRPFIGLSFAHLSFFMLESGLLQDTEIGNGPRQLTTLGLYYSFNYHVSIAFIAGFTERIAKVIQHDSSYKKSTSTKTEEIKEESDEKKVAVS